MKVAPSEPTMARASLNAILAARRACAETVAASREASIEGMRLCGTQVWTVSRYGRRPSPREASAWLGATRDKVRNASI
jgi:hypothetical protein